MFFQCQPQVDQLILKSLFPSKQRKLSHLIAIQGHQYLLSDTIKQIDNYYFNALTFINSQTSFV